MNKDINILIVEDFSAMRSILKNQLRELGFNYTAEADNGESALPMLRAGNFDFLITDWSMPGMDGLTLLKTVRADRELEDMPVLMVTAEAKREQIIDAAAAGVNGYIVKPFTAETLKEKIENIFRQIEVP